jgi:hypothetical protein
MYFTPDQRRLFPEANSLAMMWKTCSRLPNQGFAQLLAVRGGEEMIRKKIVCPVGSGQGERTDSSPPELSPFVIKVECASALLRRDTGSFEPRMDLERQGAVSVRALQIVADHCHEEP